jgi:hypothetical protein
LAYVNRRQAALFNIGAPAGIALVAAGSWVLFGAGAAMLTAGALIWTTVMFATHLAIAAGKA